MFELSDLPGYWGKFMGAGKKSVTKEFGIFLGVCVPY